jgi:hypothetical protein
VTKTRHLFLFVVVSVVLLGSCNLPNKLLTASQTPTAPIGWPTVNSTSQNSSTVIANQPNLPDPASTQPVPTEFTFTSPTPVGSVPTLSSTSLTLYTINADFDYLGHFISVSEVISYVNHSKDELVYIILAVEPNLWKGSFTLLSLTWGNGENIDHYDLSGDQLRIPLSIPLEPLHGVEISANYQIDIPPLQDVSNANEPMPYGYSIRQTNLVDWYLYVPAYRDGEGWLVHPPAGFGEHQVFDIANYQVSITISEPVQNLVIAASAPAEQNGDTYSYYLESARSFALSAGTEFFVQSANAGDVTVYSYSFPYDKFAGEEALQNTVDALLLYSRLIMPYPHSSLSVVEADFLDGMEYDGLFFLSRGFYDLYDGTPKGYLTIIAAHETAHQWWYGMVGNDQALEPWLDESLSTYMERIFFENVYSEYPPLSGQSLVNWWWYYRVNFYQSSGWVDSSIYDFDNYRGYRDAIYLNGAKFLEDLRIVIGDRAFFDFLRDYGQKNAGGIATTADFFEILKQHTIQDLSSLVSEYFRFSTYR